MLTRASPAAQTVSIFTVRVLDGGLDVGIDVGQHDERGGRDDRVADDVDGRGREAGDHRGGKAVAEERVAVLGLGAGHIDLAERGERHLAARGRDDRAVEPDLGRRHWPATP